MTFRNRNIVGSIGTYPTLFILTILIITLSVMASMAENVTTIERKPACKTEYQLALFTNKNRLVLASPPDSKTRRFVNTSTGAFIVVIDVEGKSCLLTSGLST